MPEKIRILRIFSRLNIGGPSIHVILLTAGLNDARFESILVKGSEDIHEGNMLYLAKEKGVDPIVIPEMGREISLLDDLRAFFKLYRLIKEKKPNIVDTHTAKAGVLGRGAAILYNFFTSYKLKTKKLKFSRKLRLNPQSPNDNYPVKLIHTFHGHIFDRYFNPFKTNLFLWIERFLGLFTNKIVTVSEKQREEILGFGIGNNEKVISIPLGLELERFLDIDRDVGQLRKELGVSPEIKLVGIVARLVPIKNHRMFINAAAEVKVKNEKLKVKFLIVGDGESRRELEDYVKEKGLEEDLIFLGFRRDLERIYADMDMVALTSLNEGSPVALIEALAAGRPVVSTDVGGVSDLLGSVPYAVRDGGHGLSGKGQRYRMAECGILVEPGDVTGFAMAMEELLKNEELRKEMGKEGRKRAYPQYDISRLIEDMEQVYEEVVNEK